MFGKLHAKLNEVLAILHLLPSLMGDIKATLAVMHKDITDGKATLAQVQALTGHTATVTAMAAQASVPTSVPVVLPPAPAPAQAAQSEQASIVAGVDPMKGVHLP